MDPLSYLANNFNIVQVKNILSIEHRYLSTKLQEN